MGKTISFRFKPNRPEDQAFAQLFLESQREKLLEQKEAKIKRDNDDIDPMLK